MRFNVCNFHDLTKFTKFSYYIYVNLTCIRTCMIVYINVMVYIYTVQVNIYHSKYISEMITYIPYIYIDTDITLTGGYQGVNSHSGVIEILYSGSWGRVCDDEWDLLDATVACRQLGYSYALTAHEGKDVFGVGSATIILDDLKCTGEELSLFECNHRGYNTHDCTLNENAGVTCYKG